MPFALNQARRSKNNKRGWMPAGTSRPNAVCAILVSLLAGSAVEAQTPTDETAPLTVPDPMNPRYSYGAGKLISEIMAINFGRKFFERVLVFRPHNVYGADMGWEHVIPQFALRLDHDVRSLRCHRRLSP